MKIGIDFYKESLEQLVQKLKGIHDGLRVLAVALFGSVARGEAGFSSDIDLIVVYEGSEKKMSDQFYGLKRTLADEHLSDRLLPIFLDKKDLRDHPHILLDVLDHGKILYDTGVMRERLNTLKERLSELGSKKVLLEDGKWYWDLKPDWKPGEIIEL